MTSSPSYGDEEYNPGLPTPPGGWSSSTGDPAADAVRAGRHRREATTARSLDEASEVDEYNARKDEIDLRRVFAWTLLVVLVVHLLLVDLAFIAYGQARRWDVDPGVLQVFIGAMVVEVVGLVWVIVKYLFSADTAPRRRSVDQGR